MSDASRADAGGQDAPMAHVRRVRRPSVAWILPLLASAVVIAVLWAQVSTQRGAMVSIRFSDAAGLEPEAKLVYRGLRVGVVREVELAPDLESVVVRAELTPSSSGLAREGTEFWIVQPEVSLQGVSGLETLLGPRYIAVRPGPVEAPRRRAFDGLSRAPRLDPTLTGALEIELRAQRAGALRVGAPVLYRDLPVGTVRDFELAPQGEGVLVRAEIEPAYASLVRTGTRFWYSGGVGVDWGLFSGLSVQAESLDALIEGAVAFATPRRGGEPAVAGTRFELESGPPEGWARWNPEIEWRGSGAAGTGGAGAGGPG